MVNENAFWIYDKVIPEHICDQIKKLGLSKNLGKGLTADKTYEEQIVEISFVCGFFNFWNRFTDSLEIDIEDNPMMSLFAKSTVIDPNDYVAYMKDCWWNKKKQ